MFCVDTNFLIDLLHGEEEAVELASELKLSEVILTTINLYELYLGEMIVGKGLSDAKEMRRDFQVKEVKEKHVGEAAEIQKRLMDRGQRIPALDALIAGVAKGEEATLITDDEHFRKIGDLETKFYK